MWYSMVVPRKGAGNPLDGVILGSWNGDVLGDRTAKKAAKAAGREWIRSGSPGQPRLIKSPLILEGSVDMTISLLPDTANPVALDLQEIENKIRGEVPSRDEDGDLLVYPDWVTWMMVKVRVTEAAGALTEPTTNAALHLLDVSLDESAPVNRQAIAELDRVIAGYDGLDVAVEAVHRSIFGGGTTTHSPPGDRGVLDLHVIEEEPMNEITDYMALARAIRKTLEQVESEPVVEISVGEHDGEVVTVGDVIHSVVGDLADNIVEVLAADNPQFDREQFIAACGFKAA